MPEDRQLPDLMPPAFAEGLADWSFGDGTPEGPTYDRAPFARLALEDPDFGPCLEMRKVEAVQRLRYMGEVPIPRGGFVEIAARLKPLRGPLGSARIAAWAGGAQGRAVPGLPLTGRVVAFPVHCLVVTVRAVIGPEPLPGVDLLWDARVLYAHVGLDLIGPDKGVVRVENVAVRDVTARFMPAGVRLPGFAEPPAARLRN